MDPVGKEEKCDVYRKYDFEKNEVEVTVAVVKNLSEFN